MVPGVPTDPVVDPDGPTPTLVAPGIVMESEAGSPYVLAGDPMVVPGAPTIVEPVPPSPCPETVPGCCTLRGGVPGFTVAVGTPVNAGSPTVVPLSVL